MDIALANMARCASALANNGEEALHSREHGMGQGPQTRTAVIENDMPELRYFSN